MHAYTDRTLDRSEQPCSRTARGGFSLVEVIVAMIMLAFGILAVSSVLGSTTRRQIQSGSRIEMAELAEARLEQLRSIATIAGADTVLLAVGGSLTTSIASYADTVTPPRGGRQYVRRWQIEAGPVATRKATVRVTPLTTTSGAHPQLDVETLLVIN